MWIKLDVECGGGAVRGRVRRKGHSDAATAFACDNKVMATFYKD